jgi:hypothetical protein
MAKTQLSPAAVPGARYSFLPKTFNVRGGGEILFDEQGNVYFKVGKLIIEI